MPSIIVPHSTSLVPTHLRRFHPTQSLVESSRASRRKSTRRSRLVNSVAKVLDVPVMAAPKHQPFRYSDDYLTARGANPRTGLITPLTLSTCMSTPNTPGDALELPRTSSISISSAFHAPRSPSGTQSWTAAHEREKPEPKVTLNDDELTVRFPSAAEPQPFEYPGCTSEQIKAFKLYKDKARQTLTEGYDMRGLGRPAAYQNASEDSSTAELNRESSRTGSEIGHSTHHEAAILDGSTASNPSQCRNEHIPVRQLFTAPPKTAIRRKPCIRHDTRLLSSSSPSPPAMTSDNVDQSVQGLGDNTSSASTTQACTSSLGPRDLDSVLPGYSAEDPLLALPDAHSPLRPRLQRSTNPNHGLRPWTDQGSCEAASLDGHVSAPERMEEKSAVSAKSDLPHETALTDILEIVLGATLAAIDLCQSLRLPSNTAPRSISVRTLTSTLVHGLLLVFVVAFVWRLLHLLTIILWPIAFPLKVIQWLLWGSPS